MTAFARSPNGGLIVTGSAPAAIHRNLIVKLAASHRLPAVYYGRFFGTAGGLICYGFDLADQHRRAAGYVDRIYGGRTPPTYRRNRRKSSSWQSTSRPPRRSALTSRPCYSRAPTR